MYIHGKLLCKRLGAKVGVVLAGGIGEGRFQVTVKSYFLPCLWKKEGEIDLEECRAGIAHAYV